MNTIPAGTTYDVLCFGAHPDDVEMGMGGTVAAMVAAGKSVAIVNMTRGELGTFGDAQTRVREADNAAKVLGVDVRVLDHPDGGVQDDLANRHEIVRLLRELRPQVVFAPYPHARAGAMDGRANVDHLATGMLVREATKLARFRKLLPELEPHTTRRLYSYMLPETVAPSFVVDVSAHREKLVASIEAYASQLEITRGERPILEILLLWREHVGARIGARLGEGFLSEDALGGDVAHLLAI